MADKDAGGGFGTGFIVGAAIGLAIGFLYAPRAGEETRVLLRERAEKVREKAAEVTEKAKETTAEAKKRARAKLEDIKKKTAPN